MAENSQNLKPKTEKLQQHLNDPIKLKDEQILHLNEWQGHLQADISELKNAVERKESQILEQNAYIKKLERDIKDLNGHVRQVEQKEAYAQKKIEELKEANQKLARQSERLKIQEENIAEREKRIYDLEMVKAKYTLLTNEMTTRKLSFALKILFTGYKG